MARDEEPLPSESPLLGDAVQLGDEETLDADPGADELDAGYIPPDRPVAVDDYGNTLEEELAGEPLDRRLARERPDVGARDDDGAGGEGGVPDHRAGRLVSPDEGTHPDEEKDLIAGDAGVSGGAASAEEAAVHEREEESLEERDLP